MAWAKFIKYHSDGDVLGELNHCDKDERLKHNHTNPHINKNRTKYNEEWFEYNYEECRQRFRNRIDELDKNGNNNQRSGRIVCISVCVTIPHEVNDRSLFSEKIKEIFISNYGKDNIINGFLHVDEMHEYLRRGIVKKSMAHLHCLFVPELDGKLQGNELASAESKRKLNEEIEMMCMESFGVPFFGKGCEPEYRVEKLKKETFREESLVSLIKENLIANPVRQDLFTVTLYKPDYEKLLAKASVYEYIRKEKTTGLEDIDKSKIFLQSSFRDIINKKYKTERKEQELNNKLKVLEDSEEIIKRIEEYKENKEQLQSELLSQRKLLSEYKLKNKGLKEKINILTEQSIYLSGIKKLKEETERLRKEYMFTVKVLKCVYSDIETSIRVLGRYINHPAVLRLVTAFKDSESLIEERLKNISNQYLSHNHEKNISGHIPVFVPDNSEHKLLEESQLSNPPKIAETAIIQYEPAVNFKIKKAKRKSHDQER